MIDIFLLPLLLLLLLFLAPKFGKKRNIESSFINKTITIVVK